MKSNLPFETLQNFIEYMEEEVLDYPSDQPYLDFLKSLRDVYIPCSRCQRMIAPDELYQIENEEAVCEECSNES